MKLIIDGKEVEIDTKLEEGEKELDMLTSNEDKKENSMGNTIELTEADLKNIKESMENE